MISGKFISCKRAIDRVYQDAGLEVNIEDAIEWVGDVLDYIKSPVLFKTIVTNGLADEDGIVHSPIPVIAYRAALPVDLYEVHTILDYETKATLYGITDQVYKSYPSITYPNNYQETSVTINNNYIFTGFETGLLEMCYSALRVDAEGFPLVPDDTRINKAISAYITYKLDYKAFRTGRVSADVYRLSEREYCWAIGQASSAINIPSIAQMESWKNINLSLIPRIKLFQTAFRHPVTGNVKPSNINNMIDVTGDSQSVLLNLYLSGLNANNSTNNVVYWNFLNSGNTRTLNIYKESTKSTLVAHATGLVLNGNTLLVSISPDNSSGLGGQVTFNISASGVTDDTDSANMIILRRSY